MPQEKIHFSDADFGRELTYFNRSRREFIKLSALAVAGLALPETLRADSKPEALSQAIGVDRGIALALNDSGVKTVTHVPATGATAVFDAFAELIQKKPLYSFNEETAYTIAHGAALAGARSAAVIKSHGLAKAANSVIDSVTLGTTAGFVVIAFDDPAGTHSDNIFSLEDFLRGTGIPFKKAGKDTVYDDIQECFLWSEKLTIPVVLMVDSRLITQKTTPARKTLRPTEVQYRRDTFRHVLCPPLAPYQRKVLEAKLGGQDWKNIAPPALPAIPRELPAAWREAALRYVPVFEEFQELRPQIPFVSGDTGLSSLFAFAPFACVDVCSYYGGSLPLAIGALTGGLQRSWAVTGDYAFLAAGHMALPEALVRRAPLKVLIMDNGRAAATGGQPVPEGVLDRVLSGWKTFVSRIDRPDDRSAVRSVLNRALVSDRLEIVHVKIHG